MDSYSLKSVLDLPVPFRSVFSFRYFNSLQSECFPVCFHSNVNMVISAPTGSGKTVLFELCILRLFSKFVSQERFIHVKGYLKIIYIAPSKALVQEKVRDWNQKFGSLGIDCLELTGDNEFYDIRTIQEADIILTTPEKFDAVTRYRIKDGGLSFFSDIALILIDEVHLLNDPRGAALEAIVSRIKMIASTNQMKSCPLSSVRFLAVSATIPNIQDLAEWLNVPSEGIKRFGEEMRPVKLTTKVFGYAPAKNDFLFEKRLQNYVFGGQIDAFELTSLTISFICSSCFPLFSQIVIARVSPCGLHADILMQYSKGKSALVFCSTRKGAQEAAQQLAQTAMKFGYSTPFVNDQDQQERLREASLSFSDKQMQSYIPFGVGYHNGGLSMKDRNLVEGLFLKGDIKILCTTNTLAHGINLPAHTVVIKSTQHFNKEKGLYLEYDRSMILQMCGRAGRPPFDDTGIVIIMTRRETVHLYENLLNGCEMVESRLLPCVTEHLTAEIVQLTVSDISRAIEWMKCSYLYVRMKKNPENYSVRKVISKDRIEKHLQELSIEKIKELSHYQMIWTDEDGFVLKPLEPGRLMTKYYLKFGTMKHIMQTPESCSLEDALNVICRAEEISWIQLRRNEKKLLNDINTDKDGRLRFHVNGDKGKRKKRIQTREEKIFVLANDCLTGDPSAHDLSLTQDMNSICSNGCRIAKCMKEYFIFKKNYKGAVNSILLAKSMYQKLWDDSSYLLKQLPGIGMVTAKALMSMGVKSFDALAEADPRRIEIVTGRKFPFGNHIKESLLSLPPKVNITIEKYDDHMQGKSKLVVTLTRVSGHTQSNKRHYADMIVGTEEDSLIHFHEKIRVEDFSSPYSATVLLSVPRQGKLTVKADIIFDDYLGLDLHQKLPLIRNSDTVTKRPLKQPSSFQAPQEVCVTGDNNAAASSARSEIQSSSMASKKQKSPLPSFQLIDEESEEESDPVIIVEKEKPKVMTEQGIFDHIREKAKDFPSLVASANAFPASRKRPREKGIELEHDDEVASTEGNSGSRIPQQIVLDLISELKEGLITPTHHASAGSSVAKAINLIDDIEFEQDMPEKLTGENIFDHIRKRSKDFPVISRFQQPESPIWQTGPRTDKPPEIPMPAFSDRLEETNSDSVMRDIITVSDSEYVRPVIDTKKDGQLLPPSVSATHESSSTMRKVPPSKTDLSSVQMLSFDICMIKDNIQTAEVGGTKVQQSSPSGPKRQCTSLSIPGKHQEVDSFLGFKSVFSFLY